MKSICIVILFMCILCSGAFAQSDTMLEARVSDLESKVHELSSEVPPFGSEASVLILFAVFCALWAQNTGRNAWLWFFLGLFFSVITVFVLLSKNSSDRQSPPSQGRPFDLENFRQQ